ncbi:glycosyltransferase family 4 protein [Mobilitalea sibirica]|uniref:Glycosyltransferase family 4 protein n=1 Tax=Mobilitalea sibirica TaxID=1462919 RepID=A0A8J7KVP8_9FIRM|nr:glycosyltransferase family 4 protein [Mobilitalea sibirica]MBH1939417.1 glycosyltransferase family 4 protein [Mobilitalea sibirica]
MKVLWLTNVPSPYRVDFFNELGKYCHLTVLFEKSDSSEREKGWVNHNFTNFKGVFLKGKTIDVDKAICPIVVKILRRYRYDFIVVTNLATPTGIMAIEYMKIHKIPYLLEGDGGFTKSGKGIKERYKKHLVKGALAYLSSSKSLDDYFLTYGATPEDIYRYPFTSVLEKDIIPYVLNQEEKEQIKSRLGITKKKIVLSIGQFIHRKGYDILLRASQNLNADTGVYIIGGKPTEEYEKLVKELKLTSVYFTPYKSKDALKDYSLVADLFVLPTREDVWGLVINEAMANGLPVITTDRCVAGLELIEEGKNGYIVQVGDIALLEERMIQLLEDNSLRLMMANFNLETIKCYTIETMAKRHMEIFKELLAE